MSRVRSRCLRVAAAIETAFVYCIFAPLCIAVILAIPTALGAIFFYGLYLAIKLAPL